MAKSEEKAAELLHRYEVALDNVRFTRIYQGLTSVDFLEAKETMLELRSELVALIVKGYENG